MYYVPRGGNRGGADQFKWEDVKEDKGRECYLGHSLMAPVGRWQKNKDLQWFSKDKNDDGTLSVSSEIQSARNAEREAMLIALGQKVGDRLAAETMQPQKEHRLLKLGRPKPVKKKKQKEKRNRKDKESHKKRNHKKSKKKRRNYSESDSTESSSDSESNSDSSSESEREVPAKKRKHNRDEDHRKRDKDSFHQRDGLDKNRRERDRRKREDSRERGRKKHYEKR